MMTTQRETVRPEQRWRYCVTHDLVFKTRSPASLVHVHGVKNGQNEPPCVVREGKS